VKLFLDTSSLIKLYYKEEDTSDLDKIFINYTITTIFLSEISKVEFFSAVYKKARTKTLTSKNADDIIISFSEDEKKYQFIPLNDKIVSLSQKLIKKYGLAGLRSLDALQLASAISIKSSLDIALTSDILLKKFLIDESIKCNI